MNKSKYLIFGISKGLGKALVKYLPKKEDVIFGISRTKLDYLKEYPNVKWIKADLAAPINSTRILKKIIQDEPIDYLIYNVGIWEKEGFTNNYSFEKSSQTEILNILNTNVAACILSIQAVIDNLKKSNKSKIILIGSTWALDNHNGKEVSFSASKFALRGIAHSLRETLREHSIGISILNFGTLATEYEVEQGSQIVLEEQKGHSIPLSDAIQAVQFIISTTSASCVKEINMPAMKDKNI
jgi:short-subunit dehydrogenase